VGREAQPTMRKEIHYFYFDHLSLPSCVEEKLKSFSFPHFTEDKVSEETENVNPGLKIYQTICSLSNILRINPYVLVIKGKLSSQVFLRTVHYVFLVLSLANILLMFLSIVCMITAMSGKLPTFCN
jgi:hypothetical protein